MPHWLAPFDEAEEERALRLLRLPHAEVADDSDRLVVSFPSCSFQSAVVAAQVGLRSEQILPYTLRGLPIPNPYGTIVYRFVLLPAWWAVLAGHQGDIFHWHLGVETWRFVEILFA